MQGTTTKILAIILGISVVAFSIFVYKRFYPSTARTTKSDVVWKDNNISPHKPNRPIVVPDVPSVVARSYNEALEIGSRAGKPILLFFSSKDCYWCQKMKSEILPSVSVQEAMKPYIFYEVDLSMENERPKNSTDYVLSRKFQIEALPTYMVINSKEVKLKWDKGYQDVKGMVDWLDNPSFYAQPKLTDPEIRSQPEDEKDEVPAPKPAPQPERRRGGLFKRCQNCRQKLLLKLLLLGSTKIGKVMLSLLVPDGAKTFMQTSANEGSKL